MRASAIASPPTLSRRIVGFLTAGLALLATSLKADDEALIFTPEGFERPGRPASAAGPNPARLEIRVLDGAKGEPTACRINVIGEDGDYYQPAPGPLTLYSLTGDWPKTGKGNRTGKAPIRYFGRFFYAKGTAEVAVPPGRVRVEVWKGLEYRPQSFSTRVEPGERRGVTIELERSVDMAALGYDSGDSHLHLKRETEADEGLILDLMEAEDIRYGCVLGYNEPAGPYHGVLDRLDYPPRRGLGVKSIRERGNYHILSGQEYRGSTYGHLNVFLRDDLVLEGQSVNANNWPLYGMVERETRRKGGFSFMAHGGYAQSIYADFVQKDLDAVELLQFGVYRGIGLKDPYRILNIGYRFPCVGASDFPACRKLGDCVTYIRQDRAKGADFPGWLRGCAEGRGFVTTGPMLLLDVEGQGPGSTIRKDQPGRQSVHARVRVYSAVAPVTNLQLIVNGKVIEELKVPASQGQGNWLELSRTIDLTDSAWIAARGFGTSSTGSPDAESHTNPVYVYLRDKAPYDRSDLDGLVAKLDGQMAAHRARAFTEKAKVLDYFQKSRDILLKIREAGGLSANGVPAAWLEGESSTAIDPSERSHTEAELREFLKPIPAKTPAEALQTFETRDGFHMEPVAAEPLVHSPVAGAFDEDGNLYIAEMTDYPFKPRPGKEPLGAIRLLRDLDGDGRFDESHVFAEGLLWAAGIAPWKGGVFVTSPPDIWYLKDTDGDHRANIRRKVYTGFGTENEQGMLNNLSFGLDHKVYGSTSVNGGIVKPAGDSTAPGISVKGKDFRFDPVSEVFEAITGTVQFGNSFDDYGNRFLCSESHPLVHAVLPLDAQARNPYLAVASAIENVGGGTVPIHRISPLERWRQIRSSRRIAHGERKAGSAGASHHVIDAAAGVTVYRGSAYPEPYRGNVFVSDAQNNLVHRMTLTADGATFRTAPGEENSEFVRSYDNWFRPVNLLGAPDGTLYALDMSREIIEAIHIPLDVMKFLDLRRGRDQGRIYRIAPTGFRSPKPARLGSASTLELVATLENPDGWWRDTAHRLLFERQDALAVEPLKLLLRKAERPASRIHALWSLQGLKALGVDDLEAALKDPSPRVAEQAVRVAETRLDASPQLLHGILPLAADADARVRFQVALTLGATRDPGAANALAAIALRDSSDRWTRLAVLCSSAELAGPMLARLLEAPDFAKQESGAAFLEQLAGIVGAKNRPDEVRQALEVIARTRKGPLDVALAQRLILGLGRGLRQSGGRLELAAVAVTPGDRLVTDLFAQARTAALDEKTTVERRVSALALLGCGPLAGVHETLAGLLDPRVPEAVQVSALRVLAGYDDPALAPLILERERRLAPSARAEVIATLLARESWTLALLQAVKSGTASAGQIDPARRDLLRKHRNPEVAALALSAFGKEGSEARKDLQATLDLVRKRTGDPQRGDEVFGRHCVICHKVGNRGHAVGPDLTASQFAEPDALLTHVLDPNRFVAPNFVQYILSDVSGRIYTGLIASETASSVTLRRAEGAQDTILRTQIDELSSTGKSLMPEDLASKLSPQEMADLVAFILASRTPAPSAPERLDIGSLPGLVEPEK